MPLTLLILILFPYTTLFRSQSNGIATSRVNEVLELVGLSDVAKKKAGGFSLGMGQRLGLASALLGRSEEHTSELQSRGHLVCRLLLEKKKNSTELIV